MTTHTITLTEPVADLLDRQMAQKGYGTVSDYVADLVFRDAAEQTAAADELRALLEKAKDSGISNRSLAEILADARTRRSV